MMSGHFQKPVSPPCKLSCLPNHHNPTILHSPKWYNNNLNNNHTMFYNPRMLYNNTLFNNPHNKCQNTYKNTLPLLLSSYNNHININNSKFLPSMSQQPFPIRLENSLKLVKEKTLKIGKLVPPGSLRRLYINNNNNNTNSQTLFHTPTTAKRLLAKTTKMFLVKIRHLAVEKMLPGAHFGPSSPNPLWPCA